MICTFFRLSIYRSFLWAVLWKRLIFVLLAHNWITQTALLLLFFSFIPHFCILIYLNIGKVIQSLLFAVLDQGCGELCWERFWTLLGTKKIVASKKRKNRIEKKYGWKSIECNFFKSFWYLSPHNCIVLLFLLLCVVIVWYINVSVTYMFWTYFNGVWYFVLLADNWILPGTGARSHLPGTRLRLDQVEQIENEKNQQSQIVFVQKSWIRP